MMKQARDLGIRARFTMGDGACDDEIHALSSGAAEGMVCSQGTPHNLNPPKGRSTTPISHTKTRVCPSKPTHQKHGLYTTCATTPKRYPLPSRDEHRTFTLCAGRHLK
jgi:hypothetical protein